MSDSSRHSLHYIPETVYGTTPETPAFQTLRHTGTTLGLTKQTMISEELRADRQINDFRHGTKQVGGDINGELSYGTYDDLLAAVLMGSWAVKAAPYAASTISAAASDNSINDTEDGLPILTAGDKVTIAGFTGAVTNNQAALTVVSSTAAKLILSGGDALLDDAAGEEVTITTLTQRLKAGTTRRSFSLLRHFSDLGEADKPFHMFKGVEFNTLNLTVAVNAIVTAAFGTVGKEATLPAGTAPAGTTYVAENTLAVMDSFSGAILEGDTEIGIITEVSQTLENGIEPRFVIGSDSTIRPSVGRSNLTGQVTGFFEDAALLEKFYGETETSLVYNLRDGAGNAYRFTYPRIKYNGGQADTQGQGAITIPLPFQALRDTVSGSNLIVEKTDA